MSLNIKTLNCMNVVQNNLLRYMLQLNKYNHLSSIQQSLNIFSFKHLYYKYKLGFRQQLESFQLSKDIFNYIINKEKNLVRSSSYACSLNDLSIFLQIEIKDIGVKNKMKFQLEYFNDKVNKKPEILSFFSSCNYFLYLSKYELIKVGSTR